MPKFVGAEIPGSREIRRNAEAPVHHVQLTHSQASLLPACEVLRSMDTSDRGSRGTYAKRWYRWFAHVSAVYACAKSTPNMIARADAALGCAS